MNLTRVIRPAMTPPVFPHPGLASEDCCEHCFPLESVHVSQVLSAVPPAPTTAARATMSAVRERTGITGLDYEKIQKMSSF